MKFGFLFLFSAFLFSNAASADKTRHHYDPRPARRLPVEFNYRYPHENPAPNEARIMIALAPDRAKLLSDDPFAIIEYFDLRHSRSVHSQTVKVELDETGHLKFRLTGLEKDSAYNLTMHFYNTNPDDRETGLHAFSATNYFAITSGDTWASKARNQVATMALIEALDWSVGRTGHHNARYNVRFSGGWCGIFQKECFGHFTKAFDYTNGDEPSTGFRAHSKFYPASQLPAVAAAGPIHGSYGARGYHKFMILGYCLDTGTIFAIDGNSGNSVRLGTKTLGQVTSFGVISDDITVTETLDVFPDASSKFE